MHAHTTLMFQWSTNPTTTATPLRQSNRVQRSVQALHNHGLWLYKTPATNWRLCGHAQSWQSVEEGLILALKKKWEQHFVIRHIRGVLSEYFQPCDLTCATWLCATLFSEWRFITVTPKVMQCSVRDTHEETVSHRVGRGSERERRSMEAMYWHHSPLNTNKTKG